MTIDSCLFRLFKNGHCAAVRTTSVVTEGNTLESNPPVFLYLLHFKPNVSISKREFLTPVCGLVQNDIVNCPLSIVNYL